MHPVVETEISGAFACNMKPVIICIIVPSKHQQLGSVGITLNVGNKLVGTISDERGNKN